MRCYEIIVIYPPDLTPEKLESVKQELKVLVEKHGGNVVSNQEMGKRSFGYPIKKQTQGVYVLFMIELDPKQADNLKHSLYLSDSILRFSTFVHKSSKKSQANPKASATTQPTVASSTTRKS